MTTELLILKCEMLRTFFEQVEKHLQCCVARPCLSYFHLNLDVFRKEADFLKRFENFPMVKATIK